MNIRVRFGKEGALRFIGHLDVLRTFQKIFRRAQIPMVYSQGYSPHPIMSFALPLGLGLSSEGEYLDAEIEEGLTTEEILARLRAATSEELPVYAVRVLPEKAGNAMASVGRARYCLSFPAINGPRVTDAARKLMTEATHIIEKKTKTQTVSFDLRPCLYEIKAEEEASCPAGTAALLLTLSAGSKANVKPELVWEELKKTAGLPAEEKMPGIRRLDLMTEDGTSLGEV